MRRASTPPGWTHAAVKDIATLQNGRAFKPTDWTKDGLPIIRIQNLNDVEAPFNSFEGELPDRFRVQDGDILFAWSGTPGTSFGAHRWNRGAAWLNQHIFRVDFLRDLLDPEFLRLAINQNLRAYIGAAHGGAGLAHITKKRFEDSQVLLAPLAEQHRLVSKLDELFSELDAGVAALERAQAKLERYRASVLKAAVEGRLTERWRQENPPTETGAELLERILAERRRRWEEEQLASFEAKGKKPPKDWRRKYKEPVAPDTEGLPELPEGWCWATVDQLARVVRGASPRPAGDPRYFGGSHTPWITVGELTGIEGLYLRRVAGFLTEEGRNRSRVIPADTLLLTNSGATLGVPRITLIEGCINDGSVALLGVPYPLKLYLCLYLSTLTRSLRTNQQGAAQPNLNTSIVKAIQVPVPPAPEQSVIGSSVEGALARQSRIAASAAAAVGRTAALRQSILAHAFEGRLVPRDPNDEPASVLLERIRAERGKERSAPMTGARARRRSAASPKTKTWADSESASLRQPESAGRRSGSRAPRDPEPIVDG